MVAHHSRTLQGSLAQYRATWATNHTGSCALAGVPAVMMSCTGSGATIELISASDLSFCGVVSPFEIFCNGTLNETFYNADFTCTGSDLGAVALMEEDTDDCVSEGGFWVRGIQLVLLCNDEPQVVGTCDPIESLGVSGVCSLGYSCELGDCAASNQTIANITSTIDRVDANCTAESATQDKDTSAPSVSPAETAMPTVEADSETSPPSKLPSTEEGTTAPTSEPTTSGGFSVKQAIVSSILVTATTVFAVYL